MRFPRTISSPNKLNNLHVLDSHVGPDFPDGVDLGRFANNNTGKSSLKVMQFPRNEPSFNELNDPHILDPHVSLDLTNGVDLSRFTIDNIQ